MTEYFLTTQTHRLSRSFNCRACGDHFENLVALQQHKRTAHSSKPSASRKRPLQYGEGSSAARRTFDRVENSLNGAAETYRLPFNSTQNEEYIADLNSAVLWSAREQNQQMTRERNISPYRCCFIVSRVLKFSQIRQSTFALNLSHQLHVSIRLRDMTYREI